MAAAKLTFHVAPDAGPDQVLLLVERLSESPSQRFASGQDLREFAEAWAVDDRSEITALATALGLLDKDRDGIGISTKGLAFSRLKPQVRPEVAHFMLYTGWSPEQPADLAYLWSYRSVCNYFWEYSPVDILQVATTLVEEVISQSDQVFSGVPGYDRGTVSFSDRSIRGVRKWLEVLRPPVIEGDRFVRRHFCTPELLLLALGYVILVTEAEVGIDTLLTPERRQLICRICLMDLNVLDRALDWMLSLYPGTAEPGTRTGAYGRFIRLRKTPELIDLVP